MTKNNERRQQTPAEEMANTITHGVGALLSVACMAVGIVFAAMGRNPWTLVSVSVYGATLCILYLASTLYHAVREPRAKRILNVIDHSSIYLLIAGTYTPYTLGPLRNDSAWGWSLFGTIWGLALIGILFQTFFLHRFAFISTMTYVVMGWLVVIAVQPLWRTLGPRGFLWLALGGLCYTLGVMFYALKTVRYTHAVWHLFVLAGSMLHFLGVLFHVVLD